METSIKYKVIQSSTRINWRILLFSCSSYVTLRQKQKQSSPGGLKANMLFDDFYPSLGYHNLRSLRHSNQIACIL